jgi:signal transduction histidine kinase
LLLQDQAVGALRVHDVEGRTFGDDDIGLLGAFADHAALAIQNSRLYAEANEAATTRERVRLAQELHDALSQMLFSVGLKLDQCAQQAGGNSALRAKLEEIRRDAGCMMGQLRQILSHLASDGPAERPSGRELRALVEQFRDMTGTAVDYREVGDVRRIDALQWELLSRSLQEALVNIAKHARASRAAVRLEVGAAEVLLEVADEGVGPPAWLDQENVLDRGPHFGLRQMRERFQGAGGRLEYGADDPLGFRLRGRLPLSQRPMP